MITETTLNSTDDAVQKLNSFFFFLLLLLSPIQKANMAHRKRIKNKDHLTYKEHKLTARKLC